MQVVSAQVALTAQIVGAPLNDDVVLGTLAGVDGDGVAASSLRLVQALPSGRAVRPHAVPRVEHVVNVLHIASPTPVHIHVG